MLRFGRVSATLLALLVTACGTMIHEYMAFGHAEVVPAALPATVGDVVTFEVRPPVSAGSRWEISCGGPVRFADAPTESYRDWVAGTSPLRFETIVAPWDKRMAYAGFEAWMAYGIPEETTPAPLDKPLPVKRAPFREIGPVTFSSGFSIAPRTTLYSLVRKDGRVIVRYLTPIEPGVPHSPYVRPMLLETNGQKILYAEVLTNFGPRGGPPIGYEVTFSYRADFDGPVNLVLVEWIGHGDFWAPFVVRRLTVDAGAGDAAPPASAAATG